MSDRERHAIRLFLRKGPRTGYDIAEHIGIKSRDRLFFVMSTMRTYVNEGLVEPRGKLPNGWRTYGLPERKR